MNIRKAVLLQIIGLFALFAVGAEDQFVDVVQLTDGTVLMGLIVDQVPGVSLKLATEDRLVYTLENHEIRRVRKEKTKEMLPFYYTDVVLLKDGVMFSGTIVEQHPDTSLTLRTDNDVLLEFAIEEIWKILKEKRIAGVPLDDTEKQARAERAGLKIALEIQMVRDQIRRKEQKTSGASGIQDEIESLKEQMESLEQAEEQIEYELLTNRRIEERERLLELEQEIEEILAELLEMLEQCGEGEEEEQTALSFSVPEPRPLQLLAIGGITSDAVSANLQLVAENQSEAELAEELNSMAGEIVEQTIYKIPTQEEIDALNKRQFAYSSLTEVLSTRRWKAVSTAAMMRGMSELLTVEERVFLYETYKNKGGVASMALNILPIAYLGSWVQGDNWGALIGIGQTLACYGLFGTALATDFASKGYTSAVDPGYFPDDVGVLVWAAGGLMIASYVFAFVEPFWYVARLNKRLRDRLLLDEQTIREVKREARKSAVLNPPGLYILPGRDGNLALQLDLVHLSY
jgi:hypothetical protein